MKPCLYCAELIQDQAAKCRYCGEWLDPSKRPAWSTGAVATASSLARPSRSAPDPMLLDDDDEPEPEHPSASTLPVGSGRPDLDRAAPVQPASWSAPAWLANAQVGRSEPEPAAGTPDRTSLEEVALRMERIRQSAAAARQASELGHDDRHAAATLEAEPGVTLPAGSLQAIDVESRPRRSSREEPLPMASAPQPAPVVRDDDDDDDDDDLEDEPPPPRSRRGQGRRAATPEPAAAAPAKGKGRKAGRAEPEVHEHAEQDVATVRDPSSSRRRKAARPEAAPAPRPDWDDDDDLEDEPPPRPARAAAPGGFDDDFDDDDEGDEEGGYDDFGDAGSGSRPLPWIPIGIGAVVVAVVLGVLFRDSLFGGGEEPDPAAAADSGEAAEADSGKAEPEPEPEPEAKAKPEGEGQPVEPEAKADGGDAAADGGAPPVPPKPAALDAETLAKLEQARTTYMGANGNGKKLEAAGTLLKEILGKSPDHPDALLLMAQVYLEQGKLDESLATATRCTEVAPESADCWLTIGALQETKGQKDTAKAAYQKYIELAPEGQYAKQVKASLSRLR